MKETVQSSNQTLRRFGRNWALEKCRVPYTSYRMQVSSAPWHKWAVGPKLSVPPTSFFCKARETCIRPGINGKKCGNSFHWWKPLCFLYLTCRFRDLQSPSIFLAWRQSGLVADLEPQTSSHKTLLLLLLPAYSLRYLFPRANPQNHHPCSGVETSCLWDTRWALSLVQSTRFRVNIKLDRKEWEVTAPAYYCGSPHTQLHLADSPWNPFFAGVTPLTQCCVGTGRVHSRVGAAAFLLLLKLFSLTVVIKYTQTPCEHSIYSTWFISSP